MKFNSIPFCLLLVLFISVNNTAKAQAIDVNDSLALVDLYNSTNGPGWDEHTNWLTGPVKNWFGITVTGTRVTQINLSWNNLTGTIPSSIGNITGLNFLNISINKLTGTIPSSFGNLTNLYYLNLFSNQLSGSIPSTIGNLVNLTTLNLSSNKLSGNIPAIGNLDQLSELLLSDNRLSGNIPSFIGDLAKLTILYLYDNKLSGSIPASIGNLANLDLLALSNNQLSDTIPSSLGDLASLTFLDLSANKLTGNIPTTIGNLTNLTDLYLYNNELSGSIPSAIGNLINLDQIHLNDNQLSGNIPSTIGNLVKLRYIKFSNNQLNSTIPSSIGNLVILEGILFSGNQLTGNLPSSIGNLATLTQLDISNNKLSGEVPVTYNRLSKFVQVNLSHNELSQYSNIILPFSNKLKLTALDLTYNRFTFNGLESAARKIPKMKYSNQAAISIDEQNGVLFVSAGGTLSNNTYKWFKAGSNDSTTITGDSTFTPMLSGKYYATITNAIANKLTLTTDTVDYIVPLAKVSFAAKAITASNHFFVYPNPAKEVLHIQPAGTAWVTITNAAGKIIRSKNVTGNTEINISGFVNGLYYIQNQTTGEIIKLVIAH